MYRVYKKTIVANAPTDYTTDGMGALCEICVKQYTLPAVAANANLVIGIAPGNMKIQTFSVLSLKSAAGSDYVSDPAHPTTYVLGANNVLTISLPADAAVITVNSVLQVLYTVGA